MLALKVEETARPPAPLVTVQVVKVALLPPAHGEKKVPDAPVVGALKVTLTPEMGLPEAVTWATRALPKEVATVADWLLPE